MPRAMSASVAESSSTDLSIIKRRSYLNRASSAFSSQRPVSSHHPRHHRTTSSQVLPVETGLPSPPASNLDESEVFESNNSGTNGRAWRSSRHSRLSSFASSIRSSPGSESDDAHRVLENDENIASLKVLRRRRPLLHAFRDGPADEISPPLHTSDTSTDTTESVNDCPFPLQPLPMIIATHFGVSDTDTGRKLKRRCISSGTQYQTPPSTPDRFISTRSVSQDTSNNFHVSKRTNELSSSERLLRQNLASPDPFDSPTRARVGRRRISGNQVRNPSRTTSRNISGTNLLNPPMNASDAQARQVSTGAVWNVGGSSATAPSGPISAVPNGRGGFTGSGTNAPMYTSRFFEKESPDLDRGRLEGRLAAALDIDQASRIFNHSQSPERGRSETTGATGSSSKPPHPQSRTTWENGQWIRHRSFSRKHSVTFSSYGSGKMNLDIADLSSTR